ncbi:hypothetical protein TWF191_003056 [Orbilia oligospora]|uniref:Uncharacterized protein n=1 Tax=Orbilia oligospora TaxID=2813651 RepID=A0A7C8V9F7_ORBOL|nr:hypothetical protein TWF191_003056 [Orbilia oligospora]
MDSTEGKELVLKISGRDGDASEVAERISQELGGLPLALEQSESKLQVVKDPIENPHHADVVTTLDIALKELEPTHMDVLKLILWMRPQALPLALLTDGAPSLSYVRDVHHMRGGANNSSSEVNTTATQESKTWKERVQSRFKGLGLMKSKAKIEFTEPQHENFDQQTKLQAFNHMKGVLQSKAELDKVILVLEKSSIVRRSENGGVRGSSGEALQMYTRALIGLAGADFTQDAQDRFINSNNLATTAQNEGIGEVFQLCQCVLKAISCDQDHKACPDWETILTVIRNIAHALSYQVSSGEGTELHREILATEVKLIGDEDPATIYTAGGLIISLAENRRYEEALELCSHFIPRLISIYGGNDWPTLNTLYYQAMALFGQGNYDEARQILEMVISRVKNTYGEDHSFVYQSTRLLGQVLEKQGHDDEAMTYFEQAYSGSERLFGNNHYEIAESLYIYTATHT